MLHKTALERYEKLKKVFARLMDHFNRDDLDDFVQTANSLRDWIRRDDGLTDDQRAALERFVVNESLDWQICNQIANSQKHQDSNPRFRKHGRNDLASIPKVKTVNVKPGGRGIVVPPSMQVVGAGEEILIDCDGRQESGLAFVVRTFRHFHYIFELAPIPPTERVVPSLSDLLLARPAPSSHKG